MMNFIVDEDKLKLLIDTLTQYYLDTKNTSGW